MKHLSMDEYIRTIENIQDGVLSVFLGAGASIQSGVPSAGDMVWEFKRKLYCTANKISEEYYKDLQSEITKTSLQNFFDGLTGFPTYGDGQEYSFYFEKCYPSIEARREYIYNKLSEKKPSIGYLCLGSLVNQKIIRTVLTTNFDPLIESGIKSINPLQQIVAISSSLNPQASIIESIPQIIKMHGDYLYDRIQNTAEELQKLERHIGQLSATRLSDNQLLVIGYSGICLDDKNSKGHLQALSAALNYKNINTFNITDSFYSKGFIEEGSVTLSTVYKAKGNEAAIVYVMGTQVFEQGKNRRSMRNKIFTAFTRAKGWLKISGVDIEDGQLWREIFQVINDNFTLKFTQTEPKFTVERGKKADRGTKIKQKIEELKQAGYNKEDISSMLEEIYGDTE